MFEYKRYLYNQLTRVGIFLFGSLLIPIGMIVGSIGHKSIKHGFFTETTPNYFFAIIGFIIVVIGLITMGYSFDKKS